MESKASQGGVDVLALMMHQPVDRTLADNRVRMFQQGHEEGNNGGRGERRPGDFRSEGEERRFELTGLQSAEQTLGRFVGPPLEVCLRGRLRIGLR